MKQFKPLLFVFLSLFLAQSALGRYGDRKFDLSVFDQQTSQERGSDSRIESGLLVFVYTTGTKTLATLYGDDRRTALANPIPRATFTTMKAIRFYAAATSVDIYVAGSDGTDGFFSSVGYSKHSLTIDKSVPKKHLVIPFSASDNTEVDTGIDLPYGALVTDAAINVVTTDATETLSVGLLASETAGDADGFLAAVSVASAGVPANVAYTVGSNETYLSAVTLGALLAAFSLGNDVATDVGSVARLRHHVTGANATSVTYTGSAGSDTAAGYIHLWFDVIR